MPSKRPNGKKKVKSDEALILWLMDKPYRIMKAMDEGCGSATEISESLGVSISWVSKRTGKLESLGLIDKGRPDANGVRAIGLTEKGRRIIQKIEDIKTINLFVELKRALDMTDESDERRVAIRDEITSLKKMKPAGEVGDGNLDTLYSKVIEASASGIKDWYASEEVVWLFSTITSDRWDEHSRILLVKLIEKAIIEGRSDREYISFFLGMIGPLRSIAIDDGRSSEIRLESIKTIGEMRDRKGTIPDKTIEAMLQIAWHMLSPDHAGFELMESAISEVLGDWSAIMDEGQREMLSLSIESARF
ncbi:MAG: hypothetical protein WC375_02965, partial [Methanomassiliicoccales archaeon]